MINKHIENYCKEYWLIENYDTAVADETQMYDIHHRAEISEDGEHILITPEELKKKKLYYDRPPEELIFLTRSEHKQLHNGTIEFREKCSSKTGERNGFYGKRHSDETKKKLSAALTGGHWKLSEETKKKQSAWQKGKPRMKYKFEDENGEIHIMDKAAAKRCHPSWKLIEENK